MSLSLSDVCRTDRVSVNLAIRNGKPCIKSTSITVYDVLEYLAGGMSEDDMLDVGRAGTTAIAELRASATLAAAATAGIRPA